MALKNFGASDVIAFRASQPLSYGKQITLLNQSAQSQDGNAWDALFPDNGFGTIRGEALRAGTYIVFNCVKSGGTQFYHKAVDLGSIEFSTEKIESDTISHLMK